MDGAHALLVVLLALDGVQALVALAAVAQGRARRDRAEHGLARYSFRHAGLLLVGALLLGVPIVLGLAGVISARVALWVVVVCEVVGVVLARLVLDRLHAAAHG